VNYTPEVVNAVLAHMNGDHRDDSLRIVQGFGRPGATAAVMTGLDESAGIWSATINGADEEIRIPWPTAPITDRGGIRREVVALHDQACAALGVAPPEH
jgi:hypothetical protein